MAKMQLRLVLVAALVTTICAASLNSEAMENYKHSKPSRALTFLGAVEGKSYFMEKSTTLSWANAKANCIAQGLVLATIQTTAQRDFLRSKYSVTGTGYFWIAARDARNLDQFVWDQDGKIEPNVLTLSNVPPQATCLYYLINGSSSSSFYSGSCSGVNYFLCQTD